MKIKLFPKTVIALVLIALIPLLSALFLAYKIAENTLTQHMLGKLEAIAQFQERRTEHSINQLKERLGLIRSRVPMLIALERLVSTGEAGHRDIVNTALSGAMSVVDDVRVISILSTTGRVIASTDNSLIGKDHSADTTFLRGSKGYHLDSFGLGSRGEIVMHISSPVSYQGRLLGVLVIESSNELFTEVTRDYIGLGETGESLLARKDKDGNATYIVPLRFDSTAALRRTVLKEESEKPVIQALLKQQHIMTDAVDYRGNAVFAVTRHIDETDWGLVVKIDRTEVLKPLNRMRNLFMALVVVTTALVLPLSFIVAGTFLRPIVQLTNTARKISAGDLRTRAEVSSDDEIGELQQHFNAMTDELIEANALLEHRVKERTAELIEVNRGLIEEVRERTEAQQKILKNEARMRLLYEISHFRSKDMQQMLDFTLRELLRLTGSSLGFICSYDESKQEFSLRSCSNNATEQGIPDEKNTCSELAKSEILGETVRRRRPVTRSDFADTHPLNQGYADGHLHPHRFLAVPIFRDNLIVAVAGVANEQIDYTESDMDELSFIMDAAWQIVERKEAVRELGRYAEALERSNKELEQFAYIASHDLQEPLRKVASFTELLSTRYRGKVLDEKADTYMEFIVDGARRMQKLINELLTYSRVMTQGRDYSMTDCNALVRRVLADLSLTVSENRAAITCDTLPVIAADQTQLAQVFQNLIGNAIKFHGEELPRVGISAELKRLEWQFSISDNGIGIAPEFYERIFILFQRLHARTEYVGTGIGLAVCKKIIERHGGRIWVESQPGKGSTFYFTIPALDQDLGSQVLSEFHPNSYNTSSKSSTGMEGERL